MRQGTVLFHKDFIFKDGASGRKLIILLNNLVENFDLLLVRTTSKQGRYPDAQGCRNDKSVYILNPNDDFFEEKTWVQLGEVFAFKPEELLKHHFDGALEIKGCLREPTIKGIVNCLKKTLDVEPYHLDVLKKTTQIS